MRRELMPVLTVAMVLGAFGLSAARAADPSLVGWWKLDDGAGTTAVDSSGRSVDGTLFGEPEWLDEAVYGGGLLFDGVDDYIFIDGHFQLAEYTMTVWFRVDSAGQRDILSAYAVGVQHGILLEVQADGTLRYLHRYPLGTGGGVNVYTTASYADGAWYHAAIVKSADQITLYVNAEQVGSTADMSVFDPTDSFGLAVGVLDNERALDRLFLGAMDDIRVYDRALPPAEIQKAMAGLGPDSEKASAPVPEDNATDVPRDVVLSWQAGEFAATHDVYFGTDFDNINDADRADPRGVLVSQGQTAVSYNPPAILGFETTYYWRIDEVNAAPDNTIFKGDVWSFTAEPFAYPVANVVATTNGISEDGAGPETTVDGSGLNASDQHSTAAEHMWLAEPPEGESLWIQYEFDRIYMLHEMLVWNYNVMFELLLGFGLKDVTVEYSTNGEDWIVLGDVEFARATARGTYAANTTVPFDGIPARYVRLNAKSNFGGGAQFGLSEVRFLYIPAQPREPQPGDGAANVSVDSTLAWRAGRDAASYDVYMATDPNELALIGTVDSTALAPDNLEFGSTYYWVVDAINPAHVRTPVWSSDLWSFSTQEFALIEGFESYTDDIDAGEAIFDTWLDGWVNETGSTVGHMIAPFAERTVVHSGRQSMPLFYDNTESPFYSETSRSFDSVQNWTVNGADTLRLFVAGQAPAFVETADGTILMNAIGDDIWNEADQFRYAYRTLSGNGSITARVDYLDNSPDPWSKAGVMIRQNTEAGAINTFMAMTGGDGGGATYQQRMEADGASVSQHTYEDGPFAPPYWVRVTREGNTLLGYTSADGENWTQRGDTVTLAMTDPVLIGLALTSHNADQATSAEFSNVALTGNVSNTWQIAEVGVEQPEGNDLAPLYVALEDANGRTAVVTHPNASIIGRSGWNEWQIPLSDFADVNLSRIDTMTIGVGSRTSPMAGGTGVVYIDDISFGKPALP